MSWRGYGFEVPDSYLEHSAADDARWRAQQDTKRREKYEYDRRANLQAKKAYLVGNAKRAMNGRGDTRNDQAYAKQREADARKKREELLNQLRSDLYAQGRSAASIASDISRNNMNAIAAQRMGQRNATPRVDWSNLYERVYNSNRSYWKTSIDELAAKIINGGPSMRYSDIAPLKEEMFRLFVGTATDFYRATPIDPQGFNKGLDAALNQIWNVIDTKVKQAASAKMVY